MWTTLKRWLARAWAWCTSLWAYLRATPSAMALTVVAFLGGLLAGIPPSNAAFNYTWRNAEFCDDCHVHDYANEAYFRSVHAGVTTCHDCHRVPLMHYPRNLYGLFFKEYTGPESFHAVYVASVLCEACHVEGSTDHLTGPMTDELREKVVKIDHSPLHKVHMEAENRDPSPAKGGHPGGDDHDAEGHAGDDHAHPSGLSVHGVGSEEEGAILCGDCHGDERNRAHQFRPSRNNCLECHGGVEKSAGRLQELQCQECHYSGFLGEKGTALGLGGH